MQVLYSREQNTAIHCKKRKKKLFFGAEEQLFEAVVRGDGFGCVSVGGEEDVSELLNVVTTDRGLSLRGTGFNFLLRTFPRNAPVRFRTCS